MDLFLRNYMDLFPRTSGAADIKIDVSSHVETVVSLVRKNPDMYVDFKIDLDEQDLTASEAHPLHIAGETQARSGSRRELQ